MRIEMTAGPLFGLLLATLGANMAVAQDGANLYVTKTCASCHGKDAATPVHPVYPKLAGQNADYLLQQLLDIKAGKRNNAMTPAMFGIMQNVNEQEMQVLADWISGLARN